MNVLSVPLALIDPPERDDRLERTAADIEQLAVNIAANGLINPPTLRPAGERWTCMAGWTRILACRFLGWGTIDANVREGDDDARTRRVRAAENFERSALSPIEEARVLANLIADENLSITAAASAVHRSAAWAAGRLQLLELPEDLQHAIHIDRLPLASAAILAECEDHEHRAYLTRYAVLHGANAHVLRDWVNQWLAMRTTGGEASLARPDMTIPPAAIVVQVECFRCSILHDHRSSTIARICPPCIEELTHAQETTPPLS